jgi:hypothetical protein
MVFAVIFIVALFLVGYFTRTKIKIWKDKRP